MTSIKTLVLNYQMDYVQMQSMIKLTTGKKKWGGIMKNSQHSSLASVLRIKYVSLVLLKNNIKKWLVDTLI